MNFERKKYLISLCKKGEREEKHKARERKYLMGKTGCFSVDNERKEKLVK